MTDLASLPPFNLAHTHAAARDRHVIPKIDPGTDPGAAGDRKNPRGEAASAARMPLIRDETRDPDYIPGPKPAFQANVLDLVTDLHRSIAEIEFSRSLEPFRDANPPP